MKLLHTQENAFSLTNIQNIIEAEGITTVMKNQHLGAGSGEVPHFETWPELWLRNEEDFDRAKKLLDELLAKLAEKNEQPWQCAHCQEENDASFELCWQCGKDAS